MWIVDMSDFLKIFAVNLLQGILSCYRALFKELYSVGTKTVDSNSNRKHRKTFGFEFKSEPIFFKKFESKKIRIDIF